MFALHDAASKPYMSVQYVMIIIDLGLDRL